MQRTLAIIKPSAVRKNVVGQVLALFEKQRMTIVRATMCTLTPAQVRGLYDNHFGAPFYSQLINYMTSGRVFACVLEGESSINLLRRLMGPTDPTQAAPATLRAQFGESTLRNAIHGSVNPERAAREVELIFPDILGGELEDWEIDQ